MQLPRVHGTIKRRLLLNYRVDPAVLQRHLPPSFRPKLHNGYAVAGICLIRLENIRPRRFPKIAGLSSENAAHRMAVLWNDGAAIREGVYIPRRDTGSVMNHLVGGRLFPGEHHRATFRVSEDQQAITLHMRSADGLVTVDVVARTATRLPDDSTFRTVIEASAFFEGGSIGYSATASASRLDGVVLKTESWQVEALEVEQVRSTFFDDPALFPAGSIAFDCGLLMRDIPHEWEATQDMYI
jgi:uncharacterized protein YqjF (DUF2071 family)